MSSMPDVVEEKNDAQEMMPGTMPTWAKALGKASMPVPDKREEREKKAAATSCQQRHMTRASRVRLTENRVGQARQQGEE